MFATGFHQRHTKPATNALGPIIVTTTCGAGITVYRNGVQLILNSHQYGGWHLSCPPLIHQAIYT